MTILNVFDYIESKVWDFEVQNRFTEKKKNTIYNLTSKEKEDISIL